MGVSAIESEEKINRLTTCLAAGVLGTFILMPCAMAQSWHNDHEAIQQTKEQIHQDQHERYDDLRAGEYGAARREDREINGREAQLHGERHELRADRAHHGWWHHHRYHW
jgi:hypothetical protein